MGPDGDIHSLTHIKRTKEAVECDGPAAWHKQGAAIEHIIDIDAQLDAARSAGHRQRARSKVNGAVFAGLNFVRRDHETIRGDGLADTFARPARAAAPDSFGRDPHAGKGTKPPC